VSGRVKVVRVGSKDSIQVGPLCNLAGRPLDSRSPSSCGRIVVLVIVTEICVTAVGEASRLSHKRHVFLI